MTKKKFIIYLIILIIIPNIIHAEIIEEENLNPEDLFYFGSIRQLIEDAIIIPDNNPFFGIIGANIACWYDTEDKSSGLLPLLIQRDKKLTVHQEIFLDQFLKNKNINIEYYIITIQNNGK